MSSSQSFDLPVNIPGYGVVGVVAALVVITMLFRPSKLDAIPTVGASGWLGAWRARSRYWTNAVDLLQEGYEKHKSALFKVTALNHWLVILNSRAHVEELLKAPIDTLSLADAIKNRLQSNYTMEPEVDDHPYHVPIVRSRLTQNIGALYPVIRDEIITAFDEVLDLKWNEWKSVPALSSIEQIICRTSNRVFVGLPLCRNPDWLGLNIEFAMDAGKGAFFIALFPDLLKPLATRLFTATYQSKHRARKLLGPIIEERKKYLDEYGSEWSEKPNDFLSWLMEEAEGPELSVKSLTARIMAVNASSVHTTSSSFTHALLYLAANPQCIQPLREEVEGIVETEGWSKAALGKMRKVDSFLKECQRIEGIHCLSLERMALKDFTFSDGTFIPKGTMIAMAAHSVHYDEAFYENAHTWEPFRFAEEESGMKHQFVSTSTEYLSFGHSRQACPGRFFAVTEMKTMLAHIVMTYDVKLEDDATRPQALAIVTANLPNPRARVMFRRRVN